jgi:hypothetical protein
MRTPASASRTCSSWCGASGSTLTAPQTEPALGVANPVRQASDGIGIAVRRDGALRLEQRSPGSSREQPAFLLRVHELALGEPGKRGGHCWAPSRHELGQHLVG